jgi:hypothetical protein
MDYRELMRRKLLEEMYDKMSDEDKRTYAQLTMQDKDHHEIMQALNRQQSSMDDVQQQISQHGWLSDFSSNIAGNAVWDGAVWLVSRLLRKL